MPVEARFVQSTGSVTPKLSIINLPLALSNDRLRQSRLSPGVEIVLRHEPSQGGQQLIPQDRRGLSGQDAGQVPSAPLRGPWNLFARVRDMAVFHYQLDVL